MALLEPEAVATRLPASSMVKARTTTEVMETSEGAAGKAVPSSPTARSKAAPSANSTSRSASPTTLPPSKAAGHTTARRVQRICPYVLLHGEGRFIIACVTQTQTRPAATAGDQAGALPLNSLRSLQASFVANPAYRLAQNAVTRTSLDDVALNHRVAFGTDHSFSISLDDWGVTDQKQTGRCWMFAGLNLLRFAARRSLGVKEFEFSQNFVMFWDKIERANYFFEAIVESADRVLDDRHVAFLLDQPLSDGGQWNMFINLVRKHGLVPKACMPETDSSSSSRDWTRTRPRGRGCSCDLRAGSRRARTAYAQHPHVLNDGYSTTDGPRRSLSRARGT